MIQKILIAGTGALATLFAARLSAAGVQVSILGTWQEGLQALASRGATLVHPDGTSESWHVTVRQPGDTRPVDHALVLVKSWQTQRTAAQLAKILHPHGLALTLQNGLGNRQTLVQALGEARLAQGVTTLGGTLLEAGVVRVGGEGVLSLEAKPGVDALAEILAGAGFHVNRVEQVEALVWGKLVVNSAINPLTAILRVSNGELLEHPVRLSLLQAVAGETAGVAHAAGIRLPFDDPALAAEQVARRTASNRSSMLQDVLRGAPTEIESISGAIHRLGVKLGVPTPYNTCYYRLIQSLVPPQR